MTYHPEHARKPRRPARILASALAILGLAVGGAALGAGTASAGTVVTVVTGVTHLTNNGDSGNGAISTWADDDFSRTLTVTASSDCTPVTGLTCYTATVSDSGSFTARIGNGDAPNPASTTDPGTNIASAVTGSLKGSASYLFETAAAPNALNIPVNLDNDGVYQADGITSTRDWFENAFPAESAFYNSAGIALVNGAASDTALQDNWTWAYSTGCESWTDSSANGDGGEVGDGNITGTVCVTPPPLTPPGCDSAIVGNHEANSTPPAGLTASSDGAREYFFWSQPCNVTGQAWSTSVYKDGRLLDTKVTPATSVFYGALVKGDVYTVTVRWNDAGSPKSSVTFTAA
jgi:hypothetical protein